jgi:hypothetical protein
MSDSGDSNGSSFGPGEAFVFAMLLLIFLFFAMGFLGAGM